LIELTQSSSARTAAKTGLLLGVSALTYASTLLIGPLGLLALLTNGAHACKKRLKAVALTLTIAAAVLTPWTLRNYAEFDVWPLIRSGSGQVIHTGNVALATTFAPELVEGAEEVPPPWRAATVTDALEKASGLTARRELERYQRELVETRAPPNYDAMDEVERDREYRRQAEDFIAEEPLLVLKMTIAKAIAFAFTLWSVPSILAGVGIVGLLLVAKQNDGRVIPLVLAAYAAPYVVTIPLIYRYRYPMDPLLAVGVGILGSWVLYSIAGSPRVRVLFDVAAATDRSGPH
jgi:4-amino-4-deoxy-L-arabinose transferase-like glycosyltransferase